MSVVPPPRTLASATDGCASTSDYLLDIMMIHVRSNTAVVYRKKVSRKHESNGTVQMTPIRV
ncbi:hypothetical protein RvY_05653 [Ramazzottius varieornatus]|uniref:Uncharacterized protein n=1 Tax=Ramazzottius varieornatus TaxID=947166 RepID=A0A1D1UZD5_RAMVA|nr:hypothetical protein RvY_05653 [Ramazzottius varieornatus]